MPAGMPRRILERIFPIFLDFGMPAAVQAYLTLQIKIGVLYIQHFFTFCSSLGDFIDAYNHAENVKILKLPNVWHESNLTPILTM